MSKKNGSEYNADASMEGLVMIFKHSHKMH